jgi:benzylsuccinate CoA-transferase BbsE subunit
MSGPLSHIRALDLTDIKGAWGARVLADLGADVIRIEGPAGDPLRQLRPFYKDEVHPERSLTHWFYNAGKRSLELDLDTAEGAANLGRIAATADILIESSSPGHMEQLGLGYETLRQTAPRLIYVAITPFGQSGPLAHCPATDLTLCAMGGMMYVNGNPESPPLVAFGQQSYHIGSYFGAMSAMAALQARRRTGQGQFIDVSIEASVASFIEHVNVFYLYNQRIAKRQGSLHWSLAFATFRAKDGYVSISFFHQWDALVAWLLGEGAADDLADEQYRDLRWAAGRVDHVREVIARWAATKTVEELFREGQERRFPWAGVYDIAGALAIPQLGERGFWTPVAHDELGTTVTYPGAPYLLSKTPFAIARRSPLMGEHTSEVLAELPGG